MAFELRAIPVPEPEASGYRFAFYEDKLLVKVSNDNLSIPTSESLQQYDIWPEISIYLGRLNSIPCFAGGIKTSSFPDDKYKLIGLRQLFGQIDDELFWLAARAYHLANWDRNTQFCGRCGSKTEFKDNEHSKLCPSCGFITYPKISPAIIVAITKEDKLLLAKNALNKSNFYSVLAGFVEPGETLEECVVREVKEEAGIEVKNIKYFGSQPWPFPDSLMVGFTAEYAGGELVIDKNELADAGWYTVDELPPIPGKMSVAWKLINWFVNNHKSKIS